MTEAYIPEKGSYFRKKRLHYKRSAPGVTTYVYDEEQGKVVEISQASPKAQPRKSVHYKSGDCYKGWYEHIDTEPIYIESKQHLRRECEKRGVLAKALLKPKSQGKGWEMSRR